MPSPSRSLSVRRVTRAMHAWRPLAGAWAIAFACSVVIAHGAGAMTASEVVNPRITSGSWVSDMAGVLGSGARAEIDSLCARLERRNGAELAVVTVPSTDPLTTKQFATELFNLWHVGKSDADNGVLVVIDVGAHRVEVETGYGAETPLPDGRVGRILDEFVIPSYRRGDWDAGTVAGVRAMATALAGGGWAEESRPAGPRVRSDGVFALLALAALAAGGGWVIQRRRWIRDCEKCGRRMELLSEADDDERLSVAERFEESLRSVNHVVWRCAPCDLFHIEHRNMPFSRFRNCPKCGRRTLGTQSVTIVPPTTRRMGMREIRTECLLAGCGEKTVRTETIDRLAEPGSGSSSGWGSGFSSGGSSSGSSGGGSFGGGSSGGGGAGRGW